MPRVPARRAKQVAAPRAVESLIHLVRGQKVMLDSDLAALYGVPTKRLNEAVKRNLSRFPTNFMFRLTSDEAAHLTGSSGPAGHDGPSANPTAGRTR